jgi:prevent-host-death family protein
MMLVDVSQAKEILRELLQRVAAGEEITITEAGVPLARLIPPGPKDCGAEISDARSNGSTSRSKNKPYTERQGQYLAFIHSYTMTHRRAPSELEMQNYFKVSPPSVHQMVLTLERRGLIERKPGQGINYTPASAGGTA